MVIAVAGILVILAGILEQRISPQDLSPSLFSTVNIILETLTIALCLAIFEVRWLTRKFGSDLRSMLIASLFLSIGILTMLRLLTFPDMPSIEGPKEGFNHSLYFGVISRFAVGAAMLVAAFISYDRPATPRIRLILVGAFAAFSIAAVAIVLNPWFGLPPLFIEGTGNTSLSIYLEYTSTALIFASAVAFARLAIRHRDQRFSIVAAGLVLVSQAGFAYARTADQFDQVFLVARSVSLIGLLLIFYAVVKTSLVRPYESLALATRRYESTKEEAVKKTAELNLLAEDLAERRQIERALRESERRLFRFLDNLPLGIIVVDTTGKQLFANEMSRKLTGKNIDPKLPSEQLPEYYQIYVAGTDEIYPNERAPIFRALAGETTNVDDVEIRRPDGTRRLEVWGAPVIDEDGKVAYGIGAFQEITKRKQDEEEIKRLNEDLADQAERLLAVNAELEAFSYSVSHDLRAPIRAIDGFSKALLDDYGDGLDKTGKDYLARIRNNCQRMGELIDDMLKLSRVTRDNMKLEEVDLSTMAGVILEELQRSQPERKATVRIEKNIMVRGDMRLYRILMENLLGNAWKFTNKRPVAKIEFGVTVMNDETVYYIKDNGAGFDMANAQKLFAPFQRLHSTSDFPGTGIGLATAQRIVHRHGGRIWADSHPNTGATFYFTEGM